MLSPPSQAPAIVIGEKVAHLDELLKYTINEPAPAPRISHIIVAHHRETILAFDDTQEMTKERIRERE